jgi:hypothetical protein
MNVKVLRWVLRAPGVAWNGGVGAA